MQQLSTPNHAEFGTGASLAEISALITSQREHQSLQNDKLRQEAKVDKQDIEARLLEQHAETKGLEARLREQAVEGAKLAMEGKLREQAAEARLREQALEYEAKLREQALELRERALEAKLRDQTLQAKMTGLLQARLEALHSSKLLDDEELYAIEDIIADSETGDVRVSQLITLSDKMKSDKAFARQVRRKYC